ncbi:MerR family DNA-binding transcriptional regulator [Winogradskya humida]|nr:MerR family DNA-binding transcriptional regulator [Actinoplanes humidus]
MTTPADVPLGIRELSELTGLTPDTLRWYEREGIIPAVHRAPEDSRRHYPATIRAVHLIQALRLRTKIDDYNDMIATGRACEHG